MQHRSPARMRAPRGDRPRASRLSLSSASRIERADSDGYYRERQKQNVLPRISRKLDGAKADEDCECKERSGQCDGGERKKHFCG